MALLFVVASPAQADASSDVPPWQLQYFAGSQSCDQLHEVLEPARAPEWLSAAFESPINRPGHLWLRMTSVERIALGSSWIASAEHVSIKEMVVVFTSASEPANTPGVSNATERPAWVAKTLSRIKPERPFQFGNNSLIVELPRNLVPGQNWLFCMVGLTKTTNISPAFLKLYSEASFREKVLLASQFDTACLAIIFAMALSALFFAVTLRDPVYLWYAGHVVAFAVFELRANGTIFRWLEAWPPLLTYMLGDLALGVSVFCSCKFALIFLDLPQAFVQRPGWQSLIKWLEFMAWFSLFFSALTMLFRVPVLKPWLTFAPTGVNIVIAFACIMVLACAIQLSWHGKRLAHFYLASSLPLVLGGIIATAFALFIDDSAGVTPYLLPLAAFEALVLSLGMADRALSLRLERDDARNSAEHDPLTNKLNRRGLLARLQQAQERIQKNAAESCALLYCDLDFFKHINDNFGHDAGDQCLLHFAKTAQDVLRNNLDRQRARRTDDIGRIGGEEFVVLLHCCTTQNAVAIAERICAQVRRAPVPWKEREITMTVSIGVAMVLATDLPNAALTRADAALYRAKHQGRDRVCLASLEA